MIGAAALLCLTQAIYYESRGEPILGQYAVAEVIMNRVESPLFPDDVCSVVNQDLGPQPWDCQFSYACDGKREDMPNVAARVQAERIAYIVGSGVTEVAHGATYFHATSVSPRWSRQFTMVREIGVHRFYYP